MKKYYFAILLTLTIGLFSCDNKEKDNDVDFDRSAMLKNLGENLIQERYSLLAIESDLLHTAINEFSNTPTSETLQNAKDHLLSTQLAWQACSAFEFGPAGMATLRTIVNTYPTDTTTVQSNIVSGTYNLATASNIAAKGLPAVDYLLYGVGNNETAVIDFHNNPNATAYLIAVSSQINSTIQSVNTEWQTDYIMQFKAADGTDVGSSLGMLVNEINLDFETHIRDGKIGIPLGVRSLGTPQADKTEAFYSGNSLTLCKESIFRLKNFYLGISPTGIDGLSIDDNLRALKRDDLADNITTKFDEITTSLNAIDGTLSNAVVSDQADVQNCYNKMQQMIVLLKVDLSSALGILITYQDNDGD